MVRIHLRGGIASVLTLVIAIALGLLALIAGFAFLLPFALLALLAAVVKFVSGLLSGDRRLPTEDGSARLPASAQVVEIAPVATPPMPITFPDERTRALSALVGKRISGFAYGDGGTAGPPSQFFLFFDDGTSYEIYTSSGSMVLSKNIRDWAPGSVESMLRASGKRVLRVPAGP
jgi:hypothetical protein